MGAVTVTLAELVTVPEVALMFELPNALAVTKPVALTGATAGVEDDQVTVAVMSCEVPSV
jgi:hypothetical protein